MVTPEAATLPGTAITASARRMKILVAHFRPDIVSGAELAIADMIDSRSEDVEYAMLTPGEGNLAAYYRKRGYEVWASLIQTRRRLFPGLHSLQSIQHVRGMRQRNVDVVLCNTVPAAGRVYHAAHWAGIPYVVYVREYIAKSRLQTRILSRADLVIGVSRDVANHLSDIVAPGRLAVGYDHIQSDVLLERIRMHRDGRRRSLPFPADVPVIGFVGRITSYKQPDLFVRAIPRVLAARPDARFVIVGRPIAREQGLEDAVRELAKDLGVADKVAFLGQRDDALELISEFRVCCVPSDREPYPRVILEAQLAGCPVVASDNGGCPEMVEEGKTGLLFHAVGQGAEMRLGDRILELLNTPARAATIAESARNHVLEHAASLTPVWNLEQLLRGVVVENQKLGRPTA